MRNLSDAVVSAINSRSVRLETFYEGEFSSTVLRLWTGSGDKLLDGQTYNGNGWLLSVPSIKEILSPQSLGVVVVLSGIPSNIISLILNENKSTVRGTLKLAWLDSEDNIIGSDVLFSGNLDETSISEEPYTSIVSVSYESRLINLRKSREMRYSDATQQAIYAGDKGFEYLAQIKSKRLYWGRPNLARVG